MEELVTISKELSGAEAQMKRARLKVAGFHPFTVDELRTSIGYSIPAGSILIHVPESEAADAREFLNTAAE